MEFGSISWGAVYTTGAVFLVVEIVTLLSLWRRRHRETRERSGLAVEAIWTLVPVLLLAALLFLAGLPPSVSSSSSGAPGTPQQGEL